MLLQRLESVGFKSFAERINIEFVPGITAVVGPNGSGKSNIIDAVRWVMGEQSARSLRGQKMEDIIFQGSDTRKSLNFAEVSIILNNEDNKLPIDFQEVNVTRRVYRSGESEFFINKQACRLKDIVDLFMDTGLGRESFSIIGQGKIDEILSSKAEERRAVFEEAAGVLKYKQRKNKAEYKLVETADNLDRVEDIIHEINQQIEPLAKQAEVAKQYKQYQATLKEVDIALLITEINQLHTKWQALLTEIEQDRLVEIKEKTSLQEKEASVEQERRTLQMLEADITKLHHELLHLTEQVEQYEGERNVVHERLKHMQENKTKLQTEHTTLQAKQKQLQMEREEEENKLHDIKASLNELDSDMIQMKQQLSIGVEATKDEIEDLKSNYIEYLNEQAVIQNEEQSVARQLKQLDARIKNHKQQHKSSLHEENHFLEEEKEYDSTIQRAEQTVMQHEDLIVNTKSTLATARTEYDMMQQKLYEGNEQIARLVSRKEMLEEMKDSYQGFFYGVKAILQARKANKLQHVHGAVVDLIDVPAKYMMAFDTVLGAQAQFVVVSSDQVARDTIQWLKQENKGRATFLPLQSITPRSIPTSLLDSIKTTEGLVGVASDLVKTAEKHTLVAEHLLGNVLVTTTLTAANEIARKTNRRFRIVTLEGDMVYPGGSMSGGAKRKNNQSLFTREKELQLLGNKIAQFTMRANEYSERVKEQRSYIEQLEEQVVEHEANLNVEQKKLQQLLEEQQALKLKWKSKRDEWTTYHATLEQYEEEQSSLQSEQVSLQSKHKQIKETIQQTEVQTTKLTNDLEKVQKNERHMKQQLHTLEIQVAEMKQRKLNQEEKVQHVRNQLVEVEEETNQITTQLKEITQQEGTTKSKEELAQTITQLRNEREAIDRKLEEKRAQRTKVTQATEDEEREIKAMHQVHEDMAKKLQQKEVQANRLDVGLENRLQTLQTEYVMTYERAASLYEPVENVDHAKEEVQALKHAIEHLGTVNLGAIEEYDRLTARHEFLTEQQTDLLEAKNTLYEVIREMDAEMTERFSSVFTEIQSSFTKVFKQLFGGGHADLSLTDPNDLLETGIDIVARPPGKKLKTLGLLSGGERALTAIALLFAILRVRPVPFCILDEVDAALDDANVERFGQYLHSFSEETQFVVITHRNGTREEADALYGVTMQESGVSRLVSVRLEETAHVVDAT